MSSVKAGGQVSRRRSKRQGRGPSVKKKKKQDEGIIFVKDRMSRVEAKIIMLERDFTLFIVDQPRRRSLAGV